jgi:hypothetical protein
MFAGPMIFPAGTASENGKARMTILPEWRTNAAGIFHPSRQAEVVPQLGNCHACDSPLQKTLSTPASSVNVPMVLSLSVHVGLFPFFLFAQ